MTATVLLDELRTKGAQLTIEGAHLAVDAPKGVLTPALLSGMRQQKAALHDLVEAWSERAALMEFDGGLPRAEAERLAWDGLVSRAPDAP